MTTKTTTKRAAKGRFRGTKVLTVGAGVALFALLLGGVGFAGGEAGGGGQDPGVLVLERRQVIFVTGGGGISTVSSQLQQVPSSPPQPAAKVRPAKKSRGS